MESRKPYNAPRLVGYLLVRQPDGGRGAPRASSERSPTVTTSPAAAILDVIARSIDFERMPRLARAWTELHDSPRPPRTVEGWSRRLGMSRVTFWRDWQLLGLPPSVSPSLVVHAELVRRVDELLATGMPPADAMREVSVDRRVYNRACAALSRLDLWALGSD